MADVQVTMPDDRDVIVLDNDQPGQIALALLGAAADLGLPARVVRVAPQVGGFVAPAAVVAQIDVTPDPEGPPTITTIEPTSGPAAGGNTVTITGTNYSTIQWVLFENNQASDVTILSPTQVTVTAPAGVAGPVAVQVMNAAGQAAVAADGYTYEDTPDPYTLVLTRTPAGDVPTGTVVTLDLTMTPVSPNPSVRPTLKRAVDGGASVDLAWHVMDDEAGTWQRTETAGAVGSVTDYWAEYSLDYQPPFSTSEHVTVTVTA